MKSLNKEIKRIIIDKGHYTKDEYPFTTKPKFSTLGSNIEMKPQRSKNGCVFDDSIGSLLRFHETIIWQE